MSTTKYFAYGSNMAPDVMDERSPGHRFLGPARLDDHRLAFTRRSIRSHTGVADVVPDAGSAVWGALYELSPDGFESIDRKEGQGWAYTRTPVRVRLEDGSSHDAVTYTVLHKEPEEVAPSTEYVRGLASAARERGLPAAYVDSLASLADRAER